MSLRQDRLTFFGVLVAVVVVVVGYLQLERMYPTTGRADVPAVDDPDPSDEQTVHDPEDREREEHSPEPEASQEDALPGG